MAKPKVTFRIEGPDENNGHLELSVAAEALPTLSDLYGIAPGATGGKSSEQFVRELRDAWDKTDR